MCCVDRLRSQPKADTHKTRQPADRGLFLVTSEKHGFRVPYLVKKTNDKGLGVFATAAIKKGSIVWRYVQNQYVVHDERSFRAVIAQMSRAEVVYELTHVFGLKEFPGCLIRIRDDGVLVNHSSNPNLATNNATTRHSSADAASPQYLSDVTVVLLDDRYALVQLEILEKVRSSPLTMMSMSSIRLTMMFFSRSTESTRTF